MVNNVDQAWCEAVLLVAVSAVAVCLSCGCSEKSCENSSGCASWRRTVNDRNGFCEQRWMKCP